MFLHVSVILFTGGGGAIPACIAGGIAACIAGGIAACLAVGGSAPGGSALGGLVGLLGGLLLGGVCSQGGLFQGGACSGGSAPGVGGVPDLRGVCLGVENPPGADGYCCGRYASYWNAFLFRKIFAFWTNQAASWTTTRL